MKRNIITTLELKEGTITINVLEKLANNNIKIFEASDKFLNAHTFLKESLTKINDILKGKIRDIFIIIEPSKKVAAKTKLVSNKIQVASNNISESDIDYLIISTKEKFKKNGKEVILVHPLQFVVDGVVRKIYNQAPINIKGDYLSSTMAITYINSNTYAYISNLAKLHNLNISQVFITNQTISNNCLSNNAIQKGAVLINFGIKHIFISINKNGGTIADFNLYNSGVSQLIREIKNCFNCSYEQANNLFLIYGSLQTQSEEAIIFTCQEGIKEIRYSNKELYRLIENYFLRLIGVIKKYISQKNIDSLPVVIAGEVTKINGILEWSKNILSDHVSIYNPIDFLEINSNNENVLGLLKINETLNEVLSKNLTTIVKTNPNSFEYLSQKSKKSKNIFNWLIDKLGGKHDWNI